MILNFQQNKLKLAVEKINKKYYYQALCLLQDDDSYEATLNKIGCLAFIGDVMSAVELYCYAMSQFGSTHNLYADILLLDSNFKKLLKFERIHHDINVVQRKDDRISANRLLLGTFEQELTEDDIIKSVGFVLDFDFIGDAPLFEDPSYDEGNFYDLKSQRYRDHLRVMVEKSFLNQDSKSFDKWYAKYMQADDNGDVEMLEYKLMLAVYKQRDSGIFPLIDKYLASGDYSLAGLSDAFHLIATHNPQNHLSLLKKVLQFAADFVDSIVESDLEDFAIAADELCNDFNLSVKFADALTSFPNASIQARKVCAAVYYNAGNVDKAKKVAKDILEAFPDDYFAYYLLKHIHCTAEYRSSRDRLNFCEECVRQFWLPQPLVYYVYNDAQPYSDEPFPFTNETYIMCQAMSAFLKVCAYEVSEAFSNVAAILRGVLSECVVDDNNKQLFYKLARTLFGFPANDSAMFDVLIVRLIELGFRDKLTIFLHSNYYILDLSNLTLTDNVFVKAFSIACTINPVNVSEMEQNYQKLVPLMQFDDSPECVRAVVYALLSMSKDKSCKSHWYDVFNSSDKYIYKLYKQSLKDSVN